MRPVLKTKFSDSFDSYTENLQGRLSTKGVPSEVLKVQQALEMESQRLTYTPANTPLTVIKKRSEEDEQVPFFLGDMREAWDRLKNEDKIQGANWELSILLLLSDQSRNLVIGFSLHSPDLKESDWSATDRASHLQDKEGLAKTVVSRNVGQWRFMLEEWERIGNVIPESRRDQVISVGDIPNVIDQILDMSGAWGKVDGDPRIRFSLDGNQGIACLRSHLSDTKSRDLILEWVGGCVEFCKNNRHLYWDASTSSYRPKHDSEDIPPSTNTLAILREM